MDVIGRLPNTLTGCREWTVHEIGAHLAGNWAEIARSVEAYVEGRPVRETRSFEERQAPYRELPQRELLDRIVDETQRMENILSHILARDPDAVIPWTGRQIRVANFHTHIGNEFALHRWDLVGDNAVSQELLSQPELTAHSVEVLGAILPKAGMQAKGAPDDEVVHDLQSGHTGRLRIAATMSPAGYVVPGALAAFKASYPDVEVNLQVVAGSSWKILLNEGLDLGIGTHATAPAGWKAELLYRDPMTFFTLPGSPLSAGSTVIAPWTRPFWRRILVELSNQGLELPSRMDIHSMTGVKDLVEAGHGVGALLRSAVWHDLRDGRFGELSVGGPSVAPPFYLITPDVRHRLQAVEAFCACLRDRVAELFGDD